MANPLPDDQIQTALHDLPGWAHDEQRLHKSFEFSDFPEAMSFMVRIGFAAEAMNHHPTLANVYNRVTVGLNTHDADNRVTQKDVDLAKKIEAINWIPEKG
jgi:4a-hydroxytetrahydrobiopterin dehydratase